MATRKASTASVTGKTNGNGANLGFEAKLWRAADKLRGHMDAAEYKHVVLGLIFLKYISDAFQEQYDKLSRPSRTPTPRTATSTPPRTSSGCPKRPAGRPASRPTPSSRPSASWSTTRWSPSRRRTRRLKGVLPKDYARPGAR